MKLLGALLLLASGCVGTEVGNPQTDDTDTTEIKVEFVAYQATNPAALTLSTGIEVTEAWVVFDDMEFLESGSCTETEDPQVEEELETEEDSTNQKLGPGVVELVSGQEFPALLNTMNSGSYCRVKFSVNPTDRTTLSPQSPLELGDASILIRGRTQTGVEFEIVSNLDTEIELDADFELRPGRDAFLVGFALNNWFSADYFAEAKGDPIVINDEENTPWMETFEDAFEDSAALYRDSNGDGVLGADEATLKLDD